jgi:hypothetical protein
MSETLINEEIISMPLNHILQVIISLQYEKLWSYNQQACQMI